MTDVFVSYAREDREFARRLVDALKEHKRESWIDWEDIEPSDRWWQSVREAIDAADAVLFVMSPDSLASDTRDLGCSSIGACMPFRRANGKAKRTTVSGS